MTEQTISQDSTVLSLEEQVKKLLEGFTYQNGILEDSKSLLKKKSQQFEAIYKRYKNPIPEFTQTQSEEVEELLPYAESFNEKRFWLIDKNPKVKLQNGQQLVSQDGQSIVIGAGDYLNGGVLKEDMGESDENSSLDKQSPKINKFLYIYRHKRIEKPNKNLYVSIEGDYAIKIFYKPMVRFYFNLYNDKKAVLIWSEYMQEILNKYRIPFQLKYPLDLSNYFYSDSGVLYVSQNHFQIVLSLLGEVFEKLAEVHILGKSVPLFTHKLYDGIGFAEDPFFSDDSFGEHRCKLILDTLENIKILSNDNRDKDIESICGKLRDQGYTDAFYRNPRTCYQYDFNFSMTVNTTIKSLTPYSKTVEIYQKMLDSQAYKEVAETYFDWKTTYSEYKKSVGRGRFLALAENYGKDLIERAIWNPNDKTYNWITYDEAKGQHISKPFYRSVTPTEKQMIAYFFNQLSKITKDDFYSKIASQMEVKSYAFPFGYEYFFESIQDFINKNPKQIEILEEIQKKITEIDIWNVRIEDQRKFAKVIDKYFDKISLPTKNKFGNYEYCPTMDGKLKIALIFLVASSPKSFFELLDAFVKWHKINKDKWEVTKKKMGNLGVWLAQRLDLDT